MTGVPLVTLDDGSREALIDRARALAADPGYPSPYIVDAVAELIARHVRV